MLLSGQANGHMYNKGDTMIEALDAATIDRVPSPRILSSHLRLDK